MDLRHGKGPTDADDDGVPGRVVSSNLAIIGPTRESGLVTEAHALRRARERLTKERDDMQEAHTRKMLAVRAVLNFVLAQRLALTSPLSFVLF